MVRYPNRRCIIIIYVRMKDLRILLVVLLASVGLAGCTSAYFSAASGSAFDDLYVSHDRTIIAEKQKAEAEARRAEAEARRAEALALQAEYEAQIAQLNAAAVKSGGATKVATALAPKQQVASDGLIIIDDDAVMVSDNSFNGFVANSYESAYARRLQGFKSATYRMPSSYFNLRYGGTYTYATAYDPAFYNIMVSGDQVWVEPRYITSMFGTWGATNVTLKFYLRNKRHSAHLLALVLRLEQLAPLRPLVLLVVWLPTLLVVRLELEHLLRRRLERQPLVGLGRSLPPLASKPHPPQSPHRSRTTPRFGRWLRRLTCERLVGRRQQVRHTPQCTSRSG